MFAAFVGSAFAAAAAGTAVDKFAAVVPAFAVAAPVSHLDVVFALCVCEVEPRASAILIEPATAAAPAALCNCSLLLPLVCDSCD